jgi:hypothetical protein
MSIKKVIHTLVFTFLLFATQAQFHTALSRSELGLLVGGSYYIGDLNRFGHFKGTKPAAGILYRYNVNPRLAVRTNFIYASVEGKDSWSKDETIKNRNLSFRSTIFELAAGVEFHYAPFQLGSERYKGTAYLLGQVAGFYMNPKAKHDDEWVALRKLGTEGQGSSLNSKGPYSQFQVAIPVGVGLKLALGSYVSIGLEYGIRMTFTDYLDDVKGENYVDPVILAKENGPLAAQMSNRSLDNDRNGRRGNLNTKDWYSFFAATVSFRLGNPRKCAFGGD